MSALAHNPVPPLAPSFPTRLVTAFRALRNLARDHGRLDQVLVFAQAVNAGKIKRAVRRVETMPEGLSLLAERPRIDRAHVDFDALRKLPDGTLGREYTRFLDDNGIGPEPFEELPNVVDGRAAWIMLRMRQTHDLWHVLTGYAPDVNGEILLQAFTYGQIDAPSALILALGGTIRWRRFRASQLRELRQAYRRGKETAFLPTFRWEDHWSTPVEDLRVRLACPLALFLITAGARDF